MKFDPTYLTANSSTENVSSLNDVRYRFWRATTIQKRKIVNGWFEWWYNYHCSMTGDLNYVESKVKAKVKVEVEVTE